MAKKIEKELDATEERKKRCESTVEMILKKMLDEDLLFNDAVYLEQKVTEHLQGVLQQLVFENFRDTFELLKKSLITSIQTAESKLWEKETDKVSMKDVDAVLKK